MHETDVIEDNEEEKGESKKRRIGIRVALFLFLVIVEFIVLTGIMTPHDLGTHTKETVLGIYEQPDNTVQIAFFGASNMLSAVSPMTFYDEYGYNGYNFASSVQPSFISYYLLKDFLRDQSQSLKLVVMDPSVLLSNGEGAVKSSWAERVLVNMRPSPTKFEALTEFSKAYDLDLTEQLLPLMKFHSRWDDLNADDFEFASDLDNSSYTHGTFIRYRANVESEKYKNRESKTNGEITDSRDFADDELRGMWNERGKLYLDKFVDLCRENNIELMFIKTPRVSWNDQEHDSLVLLSAEYDVPFLDLSTASAMDEMDTTYSLDFVDDKHPNIHGTEKISKYLGAYIQANYGEILEGRQLDSVDEELSRYELCVEDGDLLFCQDLDTYLEMLDRDRYTVFVTTRGAVPNSLSDGQREKLESLGLVELARCTDGVAYVGILNNGELVMEDLASKPSGSVNVDGAYQDGQLILQKQKIQQGASLAMDSLSIQSAAAKSNADTFVKIKGKNVCENRTGLNFTVYNNETGELVDTSTFDPNTGFMRTSDQPA